MSPLQELNLEVKVSHDRARRVGFASGLVLRESEAHGGSPAGRRPLTNSKTCWFAAVGVPSLQMVVQSPKKSKHAPPTPI